MENVDKKLVLDYVCGNELDVNCEDLENNPAFMLEVLRFTKDSRMYRLCSDEVKINADFVLGILEIFKHDDNFSEEVFIYYFENAEYSLDYLNTIAICAEKYHLPVAALKMMAYFTTEQARINAVQFGIDDEEEKREIGLGFAIFEDEYAGYPDILGYFAKHLIESHFEFKPNNYLESLLHERFRTQDDLINCGIINFLINYMRESDIYLADYLSVHPEYLNSLAKKIRKIIKNWDNYLESLNFRRARIVCKAIEEFLEQDISLLVNYEDYFKRLVEERGLVKFFEKEFDFSTKDGFINRGDCLNFSEIRFKREIGKLLDELFAKDVIQQQKDYSVAEKTGGAVLYYKFTRI